jgi:hypothetical protein
VGKVRYHRQLHQWATPGLRLKVAPPQTAAAAQVTEIAATITALSIKPTSGPALVGGDLGAFVARYGQPNGYSTPDGGFFNFQRDPGANRDLLIAQTDAEDGGVYAQRVEGVTAKAPNAGWPQQEASATCAAFFPPDAVYNREVGLVNGYDKIYFSASLATLFPASTFTDASEDQTEAGLFDVRYLYLSNPIIGSCRILIGTEQTE